MIYDQQASQEAANDPKTKAYLQWLKENGALWPKVEYPAIFEGVGGARASDTIQPSEAFLFVPNKCVISVELAKQSEIAEVFENHENLYCATVDRDSNTLVTFLVFERLKGHLGFWHPYFEAVYTATTTCLWPKDALDLCDCPELSLQLKNEASKYIDEYEEFKKVIELYPQFFPAIQFTREIYDWAVAFVSQRCFGWGCASTSIVPLLDMLNHDYKATVNFSFVHKDLHLQQNKHYLQKFDFETNDYKGEHEIAKLNLMPLFEKDEQSDPDALAHMKGRPFEEEEPQPDCFSRFKTVQSGDYESKEWGQQLWGLGYVDEYGYEDDDTYDLEQDEAEAREACEIQRKILSGQVLDADEMDVISENTALRGVYQFKWLRPDQEQTYAVMYNNGTKPIHAGQQICFAYGMRGNSYLLHHYAFAIERTPYDHVNLRVASGTSPEAPIESVSELLPTEKLMEKPEDIEVVTEVIPLYANKYSPELFNYLRHALQNNFAEKPDYKFILMTTPRIIEFELMVCDFAEQLLGTYAVTNLAKRGSLQADLKLLEQTTDYQKQAMLLHNISMKRTLADHLKLIKVQKEILLKLSMSEEVPDDNYWTISTFTKLPCEEGETEEDIFLRRMGMRQYFKELKMNMTRLVAQRAKNLANMEECKDEKKVTKPKVAKKAAKKNTTATTAAAVAKKPKK